MSSHSLRHSRSGVIQHEAGAAAGPISYVTETVTVPHCDQWPCWINLIMSRSTGWLILLIAARFDYTECRENRTWEEISDTYKSVPYMFSSGSMGESATSAFRVWACFKGHPCVHKVAPYSGAHRCNVLCIPWDWKYLVSLDTGEWEVKLQRASRARARLSEPSCQVWSHKTPTASFEQTD